MKLVSLLLPVAIASAAAAAFSLLVNAPVAGLFSFAAITFLGLIAAHDYTPRRSLVASAATSNARSGAPVARRSTLRLAA